MSLRSVLLSIAGVEAAWDDSHKSCLFKENKGEKLGCGVKALPRASLLRLQSFPWCLASLLGDWHYWETINHHWFRGPPAPGVMENSVCSADLHRLL